MRSQNRENSELYRFLIDKLIQSNVDKQYEVIQFWCDMVLQDFESRSFYNLYFDSDDRKHLHEMMYRYYNNKLLYLVLDVSDGLRDKEQAKKDIAHSFCTRANFVIREIVTGEAAESKERKKRKEGIGSEGTGKEEEKELARSSLSGRDRTVFTISSAPREQKDKVFVSHREGPEKRMLLRELKQAGGETGDNSNPGQGQSSLSPAELMAYLNSLEEADAGSVNLSVSSPQAIFQEKNDE